MADPAAVVPPPPDGIDRLARETVWPRGRIIHRVHPDLYASIEFNPGLRGNARFSPIATPAGTRIPTLYGGTTFECAAMETVFHDVPFAAGLKTLDKRKLGGLVYSQVTPARDLSLVDLSATALRKLGIRRNQLIDTEKDQYPGTRKWAAALHAVCPAAHGLGWVSRQDDRAHAIMLFGDRLAAGVLASAAAPRNLLTDLDIHSALLVLADRTGVQIVDGG